jgi:hypothetical protein
MRHTRTLFGIGLGLALAAIGLSGCAEVGLYEALDGPGAERETMAVFSEYGEPTNGSWDPYNSDFGVAARGQAATYGIEMRPDMRILIHGNLETDGADIYEIGIDSARYISATLSWGRDEHLMDLVLIDSTTALTTSSSQSGIDSLFYDVSGYRGGTLWLTVGNDASFAHLVGSNGEGYTLTIVGM